MTTRDYDIIDFLDKFKFATTTMLSELFFPSRHACYKTLSRLHKGKILSRTRMILDSINCEYVYHKKSCYGHMRHALTVTWFYCKWKKSYDVVQFELEYKIGDIVPDAIFIYKDNGQPKMGFLEVELSKKGFNYLKYEQFYSSGAWRKWGTMPTIFICGNATIPTGTRCTYRLIEIDKNLK